MGIMLPDLSATAARQMRVPAEPLSTAHNPAGLHLFSTEFGAHAFLANGSRVYDLAPSLQQELQTALQAGSDVTALLQRLGLDAPAYVDDAPLTSPPMRSLSLAVAQKCNLGCTYCYASGGDFGEPPKNMEANIARQAIDGLLAEAAPGERIFIAFMGGEPLINRALIHEATQYAVNAARAKEVRVGFGITTNGTLLQPDDAEFFVHYGFAVTISLDGVGKTHDQLRPYKNGRGSYEEVLKRVRPLLALREQLPVTARVTVTPRNLNLEETLVEFIALGFHSVGFSPMLAAPTGRDEMQRTDFTALLEALIACGRRFERETIARRRFPFANLTTSLRELHRGTHRPYPCGAGAGYFGVAADGALAACHRFVGNENGRMGDVFAGVDRTRQNEWLSTRHVHSQEPCRSCWARYLCGGGCHHEVLARGRAACDFIRGWLDYSLQAYVRLEHQAPWFFTANSEGEQ